MLNYFKKGFIYVCYEILKKKIEINIDMYKF